jgi:hypothetical protein
MNKFKLLSVSVMLSAISLATHADFLDNAVEALNNMTVGGMIEKGGQAINDGIDGINAATGGVAAKGNVEIDNITEVGDTVIIGEQDSDIDAQIGHVGGINAGGNIDVYSHTEAGNTLVKAGKNSDVKLKIGGVGK